MLLDKINTPKDLKALEINELEQVATDLRQKVIETVAKTGGHLGAGLGVIELTVALHHVFDTPKDKLIWDVGHQAYPHKILTGRKDKIETLRQAKGLSGFTKRAESEYDPFGAGHSSTSISAGLGFAKARDIKKQDFEVISVIGDGAMSAGMAYEALNNAGILDTRMIVVLNDNKMSIAPAVGAMSKYLSRLISSTSYLKFRDIAKQITQKLPSPIEKAIKKTEQYTKDFWSGGNFFENLGFYYIGPIDGHNLKDLVHIFKNIKENKQANKPILVHVVTEKGHGFELENASELIIKEKLHAVGQFDAKNAKIPKKTNPEPTKTYTKVFSENLVNFAQKDNSVVAITAAMPSGTGLDDFAHKYPDRFFDVGIAEQHAVTFAAGLACENLKPVCTIYSTFLQRAYDQIVHDVAIQKLPVRFAIDRADLVGADGPTHAGVYDPAFLSNLPNFVVMNPSDANELASMMLTSLEINDRPSAFRYPRGNAINFENIEPKLLNIGKGRIIKNGEKIAIITSGTILKEALKVAELFKENLNLNITIADARFIKPLDKNLVKKLSQNHEILISLEGNAIGGLGMHIAKYLNDNDIIGKEGHIKKYKSFCLPDKFIEHNDVDKMYKECKLDGGSLYEYIWKMHKAF